MRLLGLDKNCFASWCSQLPGGSTIVVQPKIDGFAIGLRYKYGQLVDAYSRKNPEIIEIGVAKPNRRIQIIVNKKNKVINQNEF